MKTQISKRNAVNILEHAIRQQRLANRLNVLMDTVTDEWLVNMWKISEALFNVDPESEDELREYWKVFDAAAEGDRKDYSVLAEEVYDELDIMALTTPKKLTFDHEETILEILADSIAFNRLCVGLEDTLVKCVDKTTDLRADVRGCTKAFALMGITDDDKYDTIQIDLHKIFNSEYMKDVISEEKPRDRMLVAEMTLTKWKTYLLETDIAKMVKEKDIKELNEAKTKFEETFDKVVVDG